MDKCKIALILSFIYCGLGQVYKREILKGIDFIIIYTLLIASFFFAPPTSPLLHFLCLFIIVLMWLMGMVDAYVDNGFLMEKERWLIWQKLQPTLSTVVISGAMITLLMLWVQILPAVNKHLSHDKPLVDYNTQETSVLLGSEGITSKNDAKTYPHKGNIVITAYSLIPAELEQGNMLTIEYTINVSENRSVGLGFSIQKVGTSTWVSDPDNDRVVNVAPGNDNYSRKFALPSTLSSGKYNAVWGVWNSDFTIAYDSKQSRYALDVITSSITKDETSNSDSEIVKVSN